LVTTIPRDATADCLKVWKVVPALARQSVVVVN
jgi:hypothetical protein